jgi:pimeloyl-ACP methyl ester carboxylesterase
MTPPDESSEVPGFLPSGTDHVYFVHHRAHGPCRGGVIIAPPFAAERSDAYLTCVRWARTLAARGFDTLRFDYRGTGESTGRFGDLTFDDWRDDIRTATKFLQGSIGAAPIILHGMRLGGVLASEIFASGLGDALLLWAPPLSVRDHLWEVLRSTLTTDMVHQPGSPRRTREDCIRTIEAGADINVGGYFWNLRLWNSSANRPLRLPDTPERAAWRLVDVRFKVRTTPTVDPHRHQVECGRFWEESLKVSADITPLVVDACSWLDNLVTGGQSHFIRRIA